MAGKILSERPLATHATEFGALLLELTVERIKLVVVEAVIATALVVQQDLANPMVSQRLKLLLGQAVQALADPGFLLFLQHSRHSREFSVDANEFSMQPLFSDTGIGREQAAGDVSLLRGGGPRVAPGGCACGNISCRICRVRRNFLRVFS